MGMAADPDPVYPGPVVADTDGNNEFKRVLTP